METSKIQKMLHNFKETWSRETKPESSEKISEYLNLYSKWAIENKPRNADMSVLSCKHGLFVSLYDLLFYLEKEKLAYLRNKEPNQDIILFLESLQQNLEKLK